MGTCCEADHPGVLECGHFKSDPFSEDPLGCDVCAGAEIALDRTVTLNPDSPSVYEYSCASSLLCSKVIDELCYGAALSGKRFTHCSETQWFTRGIGCCHNHWVTENRSLIPNGIQDTPQDEWIEQGWTHVRMYGCRIVEELFRVNVTCNTDLGANYYMQR